MFKVYNKNTRTTSMTSVGSILKMRFFENTLETIISLIATIHYYCHYYYYRTDIFLERLCISDYLNISGEKFNAIAGLLYQPVHPVCISVAFKLSYLNHLERYFNQRHYLCKLSYLSLRPIIY